MEDDPFDPFDMPPPSPKLVKRNYASGRKLIYVKDRLNKSYKILLSTGNYVYVLSNNNIYADYIRDANNNLQIITNIPFTFKGQTFIECDEPEPDLLVPKLYEVILDGPPQPIFRSKKSTDTKKSKGKKVPKKSKRKKVTKKSN